MCSPKDVHVTVTHVYHEAHETAGLIAISGQTQTDSRKISILYG